jgi:hypothetical protein
LTLRHSLPSHSLSSSQRWPSEQSPPALTSAVHTVVMPVMGSWAQKASGTHGVPEKLQGSPIASGSANTRQAPTQHWSVQLGG